MRRITPILTIALVLPIALVFFQNCSSANFESAETASDSVAQVNGGDVVPTPTPETLPPAPTPTPIPVDPQCGTKINVGGKCVDFACQSVVEITANELTAIPARTADGICYAYKLMSKISGGASSLTSQRDDEVISRNHDGGADHNPYLMGQFLGNIKMLGFRTVKLSGGVSATAPILVDNFVLAGAYPAADAANIDVKKVYVAKGTSDSSVTVNGVLTDSILFRGQALPIEKFATGGTSTVAPIDVSAWLSPQLVYTLDIRAEDCGGSRWLSDIYLLFQ